MNSYGGYKPTVVASKCHHKINNQKGQPHSSRDCDNPFMVVR